MCVHTQPHVGEVIHVATYVHTTELYMCVPVSILRHYNTVPCRAISAVCNRLYTAYSLHADYGHANT
jgi:hypothetical protein